MSHIYRMSEWAIGDKWYCNDVEDLAKGSGYWWIPCRILDMTPTDFILLLKETFHVDNITYNKEANILIYSWNKQADMRKFKNWINQMARKANAWIC